MRELKYKEAISEALVQSMSDDVSIYITGHAVDYPSGIFGTTAEAHSKFTDRVFDCPSLETAMAGISVGAAAFGKRPVIVHPRADFMFLAFDGLINLAAKWKYMFAGNAGSVPIVIRAIVGRGWGQGATHSQSLHSSLAHFPGVTVAMPSTPYDAKGLLMSSLKSEHPVIIFEHRSLFELSGEVPMDRYAIPFGKANIVREGKDITIVAPSAMLTEAVIAADELKNMNVDVEIIDPRTIRPLDIETILSSVKKTGRLIVTDTSWEFCGFSSEVAATVSENCLADLKAPVKRITIADCPAPVSEPLENAFYPKASNLAEAVTELLGITNASFSELDKKDNFKGPY